MIYGRSDSTINRFGIRIGTSEIYRVVEELPEVQDSLAVDLRYLRRRSLMILFVVLQQGQVIDDALRERIKNRIRIKASARHVPDEAVQVADIPPATERKKDGSASPKTSSGVGRWHGRQSRCHAKSGQPCILFQVRKVAPVRIARVIRQVARASFHMKPPSDSRRDLRYLISSLSSAGL